MDVGGGQLRVGFCNRQPAHILWQIRRTVHWDSGFRQNAWSRGARSHALRGRRRWIWLDGGGGVLMLGLVTHEV